ncbi:MAG: alpha/beta hydrolase [Acidobacteria bacterium]|nr:alpha/beta hydrolase [Acidobacteriota bacterium]
MKKSLRMACWTLLSAILVAGGLLVALNVTKDADVMSPVWNPVAPVSDGSPAWDKNEVPSDPRTPPPANRSGTETPIHPTSLSRLVGEDIPYGPHACQRLDLWRPAVPAPVPVVLYFHGGGFRGGDKQNLNHGLRGEMLRAGLAVAALNYRLADTAPFPAPMYDGARAVQFLRLQAGQYGLDPQRVGATGHSAGAGIALWLALHDDLAEPDSVDPVRRQSSRLAAAAVFDGQTTYDPRRLQELFGRTTEPPPALWRFFGLKSAADMDDPRYFRMFEEASPLHHASADDPPVMLLFRQSDLSLPVDPTDPRNVHHPLFGRILKDRLDALRVTCCQLTPADLAAGENSLRGAAVVFLAEHLTRPAAAPGTQGK